MASVEAEEKGGADPTFFKGSFFIYLLFVPAFLVIILAILVAMQYKQFHAFVSPSAVVLPTVPVSPESEAAVLLKVHGFFPEVAQDGVGNSLADTLRLSPLELNHLLRTSKSLLALNLDYHLDIEDTLLIARNSLPVSHLNGFLSFLSKMLMIKGFLNSEMRGYISFEKDKIHIVPVSATMNGQAAPVSVLNRKDGIDPEEWVEDKDLFKRVLSKSSEIKIRDGSLLVIRRP